MACACDEWTPSADSRRVVFMESMISENPTGYIRGMQMENISELMMEDDFNEVMIMRRPENLMNLEFAEWKKGGDID
uniref:Uncharacterized protein n=1 Tax=Pristionchus pacificus TaxID=54126 RepID=A0A2A6BJP1_PRIPA|eukprot:PDM66011.1 hypothetical protein PRIPAC_44105 [Pristionchus pacificus]